MDPTFGLCEKNRNKKIRNAEMKYLRTAAGYTTKERH
jgi:hypothetical protein